MEYKQHNSGSFLNFVVQTHKEAEHRSVTAYALGSLIETFNRYSLDTPDKDSLKLWIAAMLMKRMKIKTIQRYVGKVHTIFKSYTANNMTTIEDPFVLTQSIFNPVYQVNDTDVLHNFEILKCLFYKNEDSENRQVINIFFYLLYAADATVPDAASTTFDSAPNYCAQIDEIVKSCDRSKGRKYLFHLKQGQVRPPQIIRELSEDLISMMRATGMKVTQGPIRENITAIWIAVAINCGVDICDIRSIIPSVPHQYRALSLIGKTEISEVRKYEIICKVADAINDNTPRWFAMKLRRGVKVGEVRDKIEEIFPRRLRTMQLYYPTHTTFRRKDGKKIKEETPYIPDLLFFRTQYNKIRNMFAKIGDLAWCIKVSNLPESRYSVISHEDMTTFQKCIGQFTSDIRMEILNSNHSLGVGRTVRITGGMMKGYRGIIEDIDTTKGIRKFFLQISNDNAINWTAEVEDVFIEPIEK